MSEAEQKPDGEMEPETVPLVAAKEKTEKAPTEKTESKKSEKKSEDGETLISDDDLYNLSPCCCCMCACSHKRVGDATCFGCLPIRCGVMFIAILIFALAVTLISVTFF